MQRKDKYDVRFYNEKKGYLGEYTVTDEEDIRWWLGQIARYHPSYVKEYFIVIPDTSTGIKEYNVKLSELPKFK